jgi:hypothetical protein
MERLRRVTSVTEVIYVAQANAEIGRAMSFRAGGGQRGTDTDRKVAT